MFSYKTELLHPEQSRWMFSTVGDTVLWGIFSIMEGHHQYCGGYSVLSGVIINTVDGYQQCCEGYSILIVSLHSTDGFLHSTDGFLHSTDGFLHSTDGVPRNY